MPIVPYTPTAQRATTHPLFDDDESPSAALFGAAYESIADEARYAADGVDTASAKLDQIKHSVVWRGVAVGAQDDTFLATPVGNSGYLDVLTITVTSATTEWANYASAGDLLVLEAYGEGELGGSNSIERFDWRLRVEERGVGGSVFNIAKARVLMVESTVGTSGFNRDLKPAAIRGIYTLPNPPDAQGYDFRFQFQRAVPAGFDTAQGNIGPTTNCHLNAYLLRAV